MQVQVTALPSVCDKFCPPEVSEQVRDRMREQVSVLPLCTREPLLQYVYDRTCTCILAQPQGHTYDLER